MRRLSIAMWISSPSKRRPPPGANFPSSISFRICPRARMMTDASFFVRIFLRASIVTCAMLPSMSSRKSLRSTPSDEEKRRARGSSRDLNRPFQRAIPDQRSGSYLGGTLLPPLRPRLVKRLQRQPENFDEPLGRAMVELVLLRVGRETRMIEGVGRGPSRDRHRSLEQFELHGPGDMGLGLFDERVEGAPEGGKPQSVIDQIRIFLGQPVLQVEDHLVEREALQLRVREVENRRRRRLVNLPGLDPDEAVLDKVYPPDSVGSADPVQRFEQRDGSHSLAVEFDRNPLLERDRYVLGLVRRVFGGDSAVVRIREGRAGGVFERAALDARSPDIFIDGVGVRAGCGNGDGILFGVRDFFLA